tara:strand:+ start:1213 stop:2196 length:984 start_codon:yes stop_codon:yes gene_type:complete
MKRCNNCTLPHGFPGISFDKNGKCNFCQKFVYDDYLEDLTKAEQGLQGLIDEIKSSRNNNNYDCIVALSGGKDSCFTLKYLSQEKKLKVLAITIDNGFLSKQSIINSNLICEATKTDFILFKPSFTFMKSIYNDALNSEKDLTAAKTRASDLCTRCINLINSIMIKEAISRNIPMIAGGYIAGQVPRGSCILKLSTSTLKGFNDLKDHSFFSNYKVSNMEIDKYSKNNYLCIVNPLLSIKYNESQILNDLYDLGWKKSNDTGAHSSNCRINDLGIINHKKKYGFHPYELEISEQVRTGNLERMDAIKKLESEIDTERLASISEELEL